jgi:hypothetical protein
MLGEAYIDGSTEEVSGGGWFPNQRDLEGGEGMRWMMMVV